MNKKLLFLGFAVLSFAAILSSCKKDETPAVQPASLLFNPDSASFTGIPGDEWTFQVSASAPSGLISVVIDKTVGTGSPVEVLTKTDDNGDNVEVFNFTYTLLDAEVGQDVILTFTVNETGTDGVSKTKSVITNSPPARSYTAILLYAPTGDKKSHTFFSTNTGKVYSSDSIITSTGSLSADIDFGYYYGNTNHASLASPATYPSAVYNLGSTGQNWGTRNSTSFRTTTITASAWTELFGAPTMANIAEAFDAGTAVDGKAITGLAQDQVVAFATDPAKTGGSKQGLLYVKTINGTSGSDGYIELQIVVQEPAQ